MPHSTNMLNELREVSPLLSQRDLFPTPYQVPPGYFAQLSSQIILLTPTEMNSSQEQEGTGAFLSNGNKITPYTVPTGYFNELPGALNSGAAALDEVNSTLENDASELLSLRKKATYQLPTGYFEGTPENILQAIRQQSRPVVIRFGIPPQWMRMAAAAALIGIVFTFTWWLKMDKEPAPKTENLSSVPVIPSSVTDHEIEAFLEMAVSAGSGTTAAYTGPLGEWNSDDMREMFAEVPDEELDRYIEKANL